MNKIPSFKALMNPLLNALNLLGGSGTIEEIYEKVAEQENFDEAILEELHDPGKSNMTKVGYRLAWARTYLKKYNFLENSSRGVWSLTPKAKEQRTVVPLEVVRFVRGLDKESPKSKKTRNDNGVDSPANEASDEEEKWREQLHHILTQELNAGAFERLTQRLLRESGFIEVEVTGRSGDGGIDGKGIAKIHGFMSFHVSFQCKKYQGSVSASDIRDFR